MTTRLGTRLMGMAAMVAAVLTTMRGVAAVPADTGAPRGSVVAGERVDGGEWVAGDELVDGVESIDAGRVDMRPVGNRARASGPAADAPDQTDPEIIEIQGFEDATFPPTGWDLRDVIAGTNGAAITHGWSRQACQTPDNSQGAAWSVGGGSDGAGLACGEAYTKAVNTILSRTDIDTRTYPGGLMVTLRLWVDSPAPAPGEPEPFRVCALPRGDTQANCFSFTVGAAQRRRWLELRDPLTFPEVANKEAVDILFVYRDLAPTGANSGVFVDTVAVLGVLDTTPATETPTAGPTNRATPTATRTPTRGPSPTRTIAPTPTPVGRVAFLPLLMKYADKDVPLTFPTAPSTTVNIEFGSNVGPDGTVVGKSKVFPAGIMRLCAKESWFGFVSGTTIGWRWHLRSGTDWVEILQDSVDAGSVDWARQCIVNEPGGSPAPLPNTQYRVTVFVDNGPEPVASEEAVVTDDPGPGVPTLVPTFTAEPTIAPSATPEVTPKPGEPICAPAIENGDFERGPSVGWFLRTNATDTNLSRVIVRARDINPNNRAAGGEWMAMMGGGDNVVDQLSTPLIDLPAASDIVSATLNYRMGIVTDQQPDGTSNDIVAPFFVSQDGTPLQVPQSGISEENVPPALYNRWIPQTIEHDVTQLLTQRAGWTQARLMFQSQNSVDRPSIHILDEVEVVICLKGGAVRRHALQLDRYTGLQPAIALKAVPMRVAPLNRQTRDDARGGSAPASAIDLDGWLGAPQVERLR